MSFARDFEKATGLGADEAEYVRFRVVLRLDGYSHAEVDRIMGCDYASRPVDWRARFDRSDCQDEQR